MVLLYNPLRIAGNMPKHVGDFVIFKADRFYNEL